MTVERETIRVNYSLRNAGGTIVLPDWVLDDKLELKVPTEQDLVTESSSQKYPLGTKLVKYDSVWRYCKSGAAIAAGYRGFLKGNYIQCPGKAGNSAGSGFEGAFYAAVTANATSFQIADTAATKNLYEGALLAVYDDTENVYDHYRVIGNDASNGTYTICYIAEPGFKHASTTSVGITVYLSPYSGIRYGDYSYMSAMGYAKMAISSGYYFWLQTAGLISGITGASTWPGQTAYYRDVFCNTDGSLIGYTAGYQRIGYLLSRTASDYGDNFIMLQLDC